MFVMRNPNADGFHVVANNLTRLVPSNSFTRSVFSETLSDSGLWVLWSLLSNLITRSPLFDLVLVS